MLCMYYIHVLYSIHNLMILYAPSYISSAAKKARAVAGHSNTIDRKEIIEES